MCGYLGYISNNKFDEKFLEAANKRLICRGPDQTVSLQNNELNFNLINKFAHFTFHRLSIVDLSDLASQPMISNEFNTALMFNGEIYNHQELRSYLMKKGLKFQTNHSDSEVVLLGISMFGISFIEKLIGQFAISFLDNNSNKLYLVRDRLGQKPLFYSLLGNQILFSSNLKSINDLLSCEIDSESLNQYLNYGVVSSPNTIYQNIFKLKPGEILEYDIDTHQIKKNLYWQPENFVANNVFEKSNFFDLFSNAVSIRQNADVPVANFLSGGIDSTSIIKSISLQNKQVNTFSVGFESEKYDESNWSSIVAQKYETNHLLKKIKSDIDIDLVNESIQIFDEPYSDPSTLPSFILSKEISKNYKVAISGDGGDELLGGYDRIYKTLKRKKFKNISSVLFNLYNPKLGTGTKLKINNEDLATSYSSFFEDEKLLNLLKINQVSKFNNQFNYFDCSEYKNLLIFEFKFFLSEMMHLKIDRTSMANSLEVRSPFVDHRLIELILSSNESYVDLENPKKILKDYLSPDFQPDFLNRKKMGFVFDVSDWVFSNFPEIEKTFKDGKIVHSLNKNVLKSLSTIKSRMNSNRIWKLYFLEKYLS